MRSAHRKVIVADVERQNQHRAHSREREAPRIRSHVRFAVPRRKANLQPEAVIDAPSNCPQADLVEGRHRPAANVRLASALCRKRTDASRPMADDTLNSLRSDAWPPPAPTSCKTPGVLCIYKTIATFSPGTPPHRRLRSGRLRLRSIGRIPVRVRGATSGPRSGAETGTEDRWSGRACRRCPPPVA